MVLPAPMLATLTALAESAMLDTCQILRLAAPRVHGVTGGLSTEFEVVATTPCRVQTGFQPPFERAFAGAIGAQISCLVFTPLGVSCVASDRITITTGNNAGQTWEVIGVAKPGSQDVHQEIWCTEVGQ